AKQVLGGSKTSGYLKNFRYLVEETESGRMVLFLDRQVQLRSLETMMQLSCTIGIVALLVMFILVYYLSRRAIRPVIESVEKQKRFITDAGHELKTPLAIISADTEVLEMSGQDNEWTVSIRNQVKRLNTLVSDLLTLSKLEEGQARQSFREFCLSDAVMEAAETFEPMAEAQHKLLEINISPGINLRVDEAALRKMVSVLVDNAIKYTPSGGQVSVTLERRGKYPTFEVINPTDAMPEGDLNVLFERFYRADESRARITGGYGVGLSIAKAIAEEHRARIDAHALDDKHLAFTVVFTKA
ncbi:MAG: two-component sensor histidine kinase, partial [Firmicutes bacterium]|nr:two-component sensor histidine kinase [Bacillota bacterium]